MSQHLSFFGTNTLPFYNNVSSRNKAPCVCAFTSFPLILHFQVIMNAAQCAEQCAHTHTSLQAVMIAPLVLRTGLWEQERERHALEEKNESSLSFGGTERENEKMARLMKRDQHEGWINCASSNPVSNQRGSITHTPGVCKYGQKYHKHHIPLVSFCSTPHHPETPCSPDRKHSTGFEGDHELWTVCERVAWLKIIPSTDPHSYFIPHTVSPHSGVLWDHGVPSLLRKQYRLIWKRRLIKDRLQRC